MRKVVLLTVIGVSICALVAAGIFCTGRPEQEQHRLCVDDLAQLGRFFNINGLELSRAVRLYGSYDANFTDVILRAEVIEATPYKFNLKASPFFSNFKSETGGVSPEDILRARIYAEWWDLTPENAEITDCCSSPDGRDYCLLGCRRQSEKQKNKQIVYIDARLRSKTLPRNIWECLARLNQPSGFPTKGGAFNISWP